MRKAVKGHPDAKSQNSIISADELWQETSAQLLLRLGQFNSPASWQGSTRPSTFSDK
jgi:hypothetical protein